LAEKLLTDHPISEVVVSVTADGLAEISAAPETASLSRRVPSGMRAVSISTLLPTGLAIGDRVSVSLSQGDVVGTVVSAKTTGDAPTVGTQEASTPQTDGGTEPPSESPPQRQTTDGGYGSVTVALPDKQAKQVIQESFAKVTVLSRGKGREYETLSVLRAGNAYLQLVTIGMDSTLDGSTVGTVLSETDRPVGLLAIRRKTQRIIAPPDSTALHAGDELVVAGKPTAVRQFREVVR